MGFSFWVFFFSLQFLGSLHYLRGIKIGSPPRRPAVPNQQLICRLTLTTPFGISLTKRGKPRKDSQRAHAEFVRPKQQRPAELAEVLLDLPARPGGPTFVAYGRFYLTPVQQEKLPSQKMIQSLLLLLYQISCSEIFRKILSLQFPKTLPL